MTPNIKEDKIYEALCVYGLYKVKKIGRLIIIDLRNGEKHLRVENNDVAVLGDNN